MKVYIYKHVEYLRGMRDIVYYSWACPFCAEQGYENYSGKEATKNNFRIHLYTYHRIDTDRLKFKFKKAE